MVMTDEVNRQREARDLSLTRHPSQTALECVNAEGVPHPSSWTRWSHAERAIWNLGVRDAARHLAVAQVEPVETVDQARRRQLESLRVELKLAVERARDPRRGIPWATLTGLLQAVRIVDEALDGLD
jgi:hypothetical protein